ncbi:hypothetical protein ACQEVC_45305 [Plantactinospora sp. CA-294935]|uniref:hypothetical protein n=1 Tax=Plantactinospora sp. CA-294935 TaxID=3240012 RepID=UPI003D929807
MAEMDFTDRALLKLAEANKAGTTPERANALRLESITLALLSVAERLKATEDEVSRVKDALWDPYGFSTGYHIGQISRRLRDEQSD